MIDKKYLFRPDDFSDRKDVLWFDEAIKHIKDCKSIVDIGCGTGNSSFYFKDKEWHGITGNLLEVETGENQGRNMHYLDMHNLCFPSEYFEAFVMWDSLEHCVSPFIALKEAKRILFEGGKGIIFMPGQNWLEHHDHIHTMTVPQMKHLLKKVGLKLNHVEEKTYKGISGWENVNSEGMAIYYIVKDSEYKPTFRL